MRCFFIAIDGIALSEAINKLLCMFKNLGSLVYHYLFHLTLVL